MSPGPRMASPLSHRSPANHDYKFAQSNLVADVKSDFDETKVDPRSVQLEITETMAMSDPNLTIRICSRPSELVVTTRDLSISASLAAFTLAQCL